MNNIDDMAKRYKLADYGGLRPYRGTIIEFIAKNLKIGTGSVIDLLGAVTNSQKEIIIFIARYRALRRNDTIIGNF